VSLFVGHGISHKMDSEFHLKFHMKKGMLPIHRMIKGVKFSLRISAFGGGLSNQPLFPSFA
jgi:hypothetical protein